jgi:transcriptional regulator with XRE-family HTH domain
MSKVFGTHLKNLLKQNRVTQAKIAEELNFSASAVSKWVTGINTPSASDLEKICERLRTTSKEKQVLFEEAGLTSPPLDRLVIYKDQPTANDAIKKLIRSKPTPKQARIIQYSSHFVRELIDPLLDHHIPFKLLLYHPDLMTDAHQLEKIGTGIGHLLVVAREEIITDKVELFLYRNPATMRAVRLDNELFVGYYTYELDYLKELKIHGHDNPVFYIPRPPDEKEENDEVNEEKEARKAALAQFDRTWENLVNNCEPGKEYIKRKALVKPEWWE